MTEGADVLNGMVIKMRAGVAFVAMGNRADDSFHGWDVCSYADGNCCSIAEDKNVFDKVCSSNHHGCQKKFYLDGVGRG